MPPIAQVVCLRPTFTKEFATVSAQQTPTLVERCAWSAPQTVQHAIQGQNATPATQVTPWKMNKIVFFSAQGAILLIKFATLVDSFALSVLTQLASNASQILIFSMALAMKTALRQLLL